MSEEQGYKYPTLDKLIEARKNTGKALTDAARMNREMLDNLFRIAEIQRTKIQTLTRRLETAGDMLKGMGYTTNLEYGMWSHRTLKKCPACGGIPVIQRYSYDNHGWVVICSECSHRCEEQKTPIYAIKAWDAGKFTELSEMTKNRLDGSPRERGKRHGEDDA